MSKITEFAEGNKVITRLCLASVTLRQTRGNPPRDFLTMRLTDGTASITANLWDYKNQGNLPTTGKAYSIAGTISTYQGELQLTLTDMNLSNNQDLTEFQAVFDTDKDKLWETVQTQIDRILDKNLNELVQRVYTLNREDILRTSAAKSIHHVGYGGNLTHSIEVAEIATVLGYKAKDMGMTVDLDLIRAGALLHDIGKIYTYTPSGAGIEMTEQGILLDHIVLGIQHLRDVSHTGLPISLAEANKRELLEHIIASHHGKLEYGSPVSPKFAEAQIVQLADNASMVLEVMRAANVKAESEGKTMTDKLYPLDNREFICQSVIRDKLLGK